MIAASAITGGSKTSSSHGSKSPTRRMSKPDVHIARLGRNGSMRRSLLPDDPNSGRAVEESRRMHALSHDKSASMLDSSFMEHQMDEKTKHARMEGSMPWLTLSVNSRKRQIWDLTSLCAVLYCTFIVPYQMAFDPPQTEVLSGIDMAIEVFFICEIFLNFFTSYVNGDGDEIRSKHLIAWNYLRTWLPIDAVSSIPTESITRIAAQMAEDAGDDGGGADVSALYNLRIIRIVRLTKLLRLLRLGKLIEVIEFSFPSLGTIIGLLRLLFMMVIVAHLQACLFYYLGSLNMGNSWISKYHFNCCDENLNLYRAYELTHVPECFDESELPPLEVLYTNAIYWSFATLTTVGYGDITPCNEMEILFSIGSMVVGSAMFAYIVGNISSVVTNMKGQEVKLRQRMRELQEYIALRKIPKHMADVLRRQCMHRWKRTVFDEERVLEEFTPQMRRQVVNFINEDGLPQVPCFQALMNNELYGDFTTELAIRLKPSSAQQGEDISKRGEFGGDLYIVQSGHVEIRDREGKKTYIHDRGCFNELELLHEFLIGGLIEYQTTAKAQSSCELLVLRRQDFQEVWEELVRSSEPDAADDAHWHPIRRILVDQTKAAFAELYSQRGSVNLASGSFRRRTPQFLVDAIGWAAADGTDHDHDGAHTPAEIEAGQADVGGVDSAPPSSALEDLRGMLGVRRYKAEAAAAGLMLEIPAEDAPGMGPVSMSRPASGQPVRRHSAATDTNTEPSLQGNPSSLNLKSPFGSSESPSRQADSGWGLGGGVEEELVETVDQIARVVQAQATMLKRYMQAAGISEEAPASSGSGLPLKSLSMREPGSPMAQDMAARSLSAW